MALHTFNSSTLLPEEHLSTLGLLQSKLMMIPSSENSDQNTQQSNLPKDLSEPLDQLFSKTVDVVRRQFAQ